MIASSILSYFLCWHSSNYCIWGDIFCYYSTRGHNGTVPYFYAAADNDVVTYPNVITDRGTLYQKTCVALFPLERMR